MIRCLNCMQKYDGKYEVCPFCGFIRGTKPKEWYHLHPGMILAEKYVIGTVIGFGGFGVIYKAWDKSLKKIIAIKEYYPTSFLSRIAGKKQVNVYDKKNVPAFEKGKREFLEEARNLAKFNDHPNIVHVYDFFEENGTAYFVMEYLDGYSLKVLMQQEQQKGQLIPVDKALQITHSVLSALKAAHTARVIHRDIKPGNIFICKDGTVKLIDFGAARFSDDETEKTRTIIITPGYAPAEQYQTKSRQGPYTDIYAVAAVLYEMLTGVKPAESINRKFEDTVAEPRKLNPNIPPHINSAVMRAMAIQPEIRFQNVDQFSRALNSEKEVRDARKEIRYRKTQRILRIAMLALFVAAGACLCLFQYQQLKRAAILAPTELTIWIPYSQQETAAEAIQLIHDMSAEYLQNNEGISIEVEAFEESVYEDTLRTALQTGSGPDLFDSSCLHAEDYGLLADLGELFSFSLFDPSQYYLLDQYAAYFPSRKQLPLSFEVPVLYQNPLLEGDFGDKSGNYQEFTEQLKPKYWGTEADYRRVQADMSGIYTLELPEDTEGRTGSFTNLWSVNQNVSTEDYAAAIRMLYYLLSETAQDYLTVQSDHHLPLHRNVMQVFLDVNGDFAGLEDYIEKLSFKGEA